MFELREVPLHWPTGGQVRVVVRLLDAADD
jgi:hypothetical protein